MSIYRKIRILSASWEKTVPSPKVKKHLTKEEYETKLKETKLKARPQGRPTKEDEVFYNRQKQPSITPTPSALPAKKPIKPIPKKVAPPQHPPTGQPILGESLPETLHKLGLPKRGMRGDVSDDIHYHAPNDNNNPTAPFKHVHNALLGAGFEHKRQEGFLNTKAKNHWYNHAKKGENVKVAVNGLGHVVNLFHSIPRK